METSKDERLAANPNFQRNMATTQSIGKVLTQYFKLQDEKKEASTVRTTLDNFPIRSKTLNF